MKRKQYNLLFNRYGSLYIETALTWDSLEEAERFMEQRYDYEFTKNDTAQPYAIVEVDVVIVKHLTDQKEFAKNWVKGLAPPGYFIHNNQTKK